MVTENGRATSCATLNADDWKKGTQVVDRDALSSRLDALETYLAELRGFLTGSRDEFVREPSVHHLAERYLHLACESVLDISHHVIADQGYRQAGSYKDAIDVLQQEGLLDADLAGRLKRWMGLRNLLVHLYLEIDHGRIYDAISEDLDDLHSFTSRMARMLEAR
ncbi:MAG TPA: DUF86 domain-containing protein [Thermoanaerobaculia bacterium]|nr:DUF86 domain-containing protein [Thermoanaerobaculia bacterium]